MARKTKPNTNENIQIEVPKKSYKVYNIHSQQNSANNVSSTTECQGSILVAIYNNTNANRIDSGPTHNYTEQSFEMKQNTWMRPSTKEAINGKISMGQRATHADFSANKISNFKSTGRSCDVNHSINKQELMRSFSTPSFNTANVNVFQSSSEIAFITDADRNFNSSSTNFIDWSRLYVFGRKHDIEGPRISRPS
jgi:hypothetical protein